MSEVEVTPLKDIDKAYMQLIGELNKHIIEVCEVNRNLVADINHYKKTTFGSRLKFLFTGKL